MLFIRPTSRTTASNIFKLASKRTLQTGKRPLVAKYDVLERDLFRINNGVKVKLRPRAEQEAKGRKAFDLVVDETGHIKPSPATGLFEGPNGMSMRPNSSALQELVRHVTGKNLLVYRIKAGTDLKALDLVCLWEHSEHHSVQTTVPITLDKLNKKLTDLLKTHGEKMTPDEFIERFPWESIPAQ